MKKLYSVEVTKLVYVMAEDTEKAERLAKWSLINGYHLATDVGLTVVHEDDIDDIHYEWQKRKPFGGDDLTIEEML